jgi:signal transduction histidine kinase
MKNSDIRILIAEDSAIQAETLRRMLVAEGYSVVVAKDGAEALLKAKESRPELVISDIVMPGMDGYELCRRVRADEKLKDVPVILLTSLSDPKDVIKGLECGANNFIVKPYDEKYLLSRIHYLETNAELRKDAAAEMGTRVYFAGEHFFITAERLQILDLLLSTYENAYYQNSELIKARDELSALNDELENKVLERTAKLEAEIMERKRAEEEVREISRQLWQATKLATVGELAASIAHELNNPLATVSLRIEVLVSQVPPDDPKYHALEIIEQEIERMGNLVSNMLQFSRRSAPQISTIDVREELDKTLELIYYHLRKQNIAVVREFASDTPNVYADRQQLRQLFLNLFTNAGDAMPRGGTLTIRVAGAEEHIDIAISDTGTGIEPENLSKVMEPFFTTKPEGKGTGLGLPICRRIVEEHKGTFDIKSESGKGTIALITLPAKNGHNTAFLKETKGGD